MFKILSKDKGARTGLLKTAHGCIETPFFMPVATKATVKHASPKDLKMMGAKAIISNAFVLYLKPGLDIIEKFKGIHGFMNFKDIIFTDCGGFQILRESFIQGTTDEGIKFRSPFDGTKILLTPELIMDIESRLNSDVAMVLDDVVSYRASFDGLSYNQSTDWCMTNPEKMRGNQASEGSEHTTCLSTGSVSEHFDEAKACMLRTHKWAEECKIAHKNKKQLLFGICHGGFFENLRKESARFINSLDFDGVAIGGLCIGEPKETMRKMLDSSIKHIDEDKPRYLMGIGKPEDIIECIEKGVDIFDSIFPTQNARHHTIFTWKGKIRINKKEFRDDKRPLDENCGCYVCKSFSRAFINHLIRVKEYTYMRYTTYHNLYFLQRLMEKIRKSIKDGSFGKFKREFLGGYT